MGRGNFTKTEMETLLRNPYVADVNEKSISYSTEFKFLFMNEYIKGKRPTQIFRDAGFDIGILGSKRIERACARWKESYQSGTLGERSAVLGKASSSSEADASLSEKMKSGKKYTIDRCRQQEEMIKKLPRRGTASPAALREKTGWSRSAASACRSLPDHRIDHAAGGIPPLCFSSLQSRRHQPQHLLRIPPKRNGMRDVNL